MRLKSIELSGFKSFGKKTALEFTAAITAIVGPNGSGKSNVAEAFRFALGEQSMKSMRGKRGEDLIFNGGKSLPRAGRASVRLVFSNKPKLFSIDFDEVSFERVVHRDGVNEYLLNGSTVRLKDIVELLAQANIGASGHHIISQGEADRILSAGNLERREMIEDALGLKNFLYKRQEAEKKLEKTAEHIRQVESLRREIAPHLKFLGTQMKRLEEAEALREKLSRAYREYLRREFVYLTREGADIEYVREAPARERALLELRIQELRTLLAKEKNSDQTTRALVKLEGAVGESRQMRERELAELSRVEGEIRALTRERERLASKAVVPLEQAHSFAEKIAQEAEQAAEGSLEEMRGKLRTLCLLARDFIQTLTGGRQGSDIGEELKAFEREKEKRVSAFAQAKQAEEKAFRELQIVRASLESAKEERNSSERELFEALTRRGELDAELAKLSLRAELLVRAKEEFAREREEGAALVGRDVLGYETHEVRDERGALIPESVFLAEPRSEQETRRRALEKMKIKLEEAGVGSSQEVVQEHREVSERDAFLAREIEDLLRASESLENLIEELTRTLESRFSEGIEKINKEFDSFFKLMFGGGSAELKLTRERKRSRFSGLADEAEVPEAEEVEEGIEIGVHLPHKRLRGLHMLSGGERALTSIALIFAMSQVNPPPFLILDETDAALDEANSRRYGDMIENLAKKSQLILITHNRETMSRAGMLYGVTMAGDGVSRLLSVQLEEAVAVAK